MASVLFKRFHMSEDLEYFISLTFEILLTKWYTKLPTIFK